MKRSVIFYQIERERHRQDARWGGPAHDDEHDAYDWLGFIENQTNALIDAWEGNKDEPADMGEVRERWVKVAALAVAAIESHDRKAAAAKRETEREAAP